MSEDFFSPTGSQKPPAGRDPREYPPTDDWTIHQPPIAQAAPPRRSRQPHVGAIILILAGVVFFLNNTGILHIGSIFEYWPLILVAVGMSKLGCSKGATQIWALLVMSVGILFLLHNLGILSLSFGLLWPVGLIAGGIGLLLQRGGLAPGMFPWRSSHASPQSFDEREAHLFALFGGSKRVLDTHDFRGGEALALFGGVEIDLRLAKMSGDLKEVVLDANALFGGVEIKVPDDWRVAVRGVGIFGGYEDKTLRRKSDVNPNSPLLVITGFACFGGVEVKS